MGKIDREHVNELIVRAMRSKSVEECREINRELKRIDLDHRREAITMKVLDKYRK